MLASGADVNATLKGGFTALMLVAEKGRLDTLGALLDGKADVNANMGMYTVGGQPKPSFAALRQALR